MTASGVIEFRLNGELVRAENLSPNTTLLNWLRRSGRTGSKEGCAEGDCGACSVAMIDRDAKGRACFRAINSCLVPLPAMAGREIVTVEGLKNDALHPVQQAMVDHFGSQCGYCTPGFVMSLFEGFHRDDLKTDAQLDEQLAGNLCRCTGYRPIRTAAMEAFAKNGADAFAERLREARVDLDPLQIEHDGECFFRPKTLSELFALMEKFPEARLVAGATELGLLISKYFKKLPGWISLEAIPELTTLEQTESEWRIGASVNLTMLLDRLGAEFPPIKEMLWWFGSRQIRNRATMGGNLVTASPIGDSAPVLLTYDTKLVLASAKGERTIPLEEFFIAYRKTALQPGEILKTIVLPHGDNGDKARRRFYKVSRRREMDISTVSGCFAIELDSNQIVRRARLAYGGVAPTPVRARNAEQALAGKKWSAETVAEVLPILAKEFTPITDVRGSAEYRAQIVTSLFEKFFRDDFTPQTGQALSFPGAAHERPSPHESGHKHVTGEAIYVDDETNGMLEVWPVCAPHARARILKHDASAARAMPGVHAVLLAEDIPGMNDVGPVKHDEVLLAHDEISYHGQMVALVVGESEAACRDAAAKVLVEYEALTPVLELKEAIAQKAFHCDPHFIRRGDAAGALKNAPLKIAGEFSLGGQNHFYLETQAAWAECGEDGTIFVHSSTQHPSEVQLAIAHVLDLPMNHVVVQIARMGGGFGGKETQAAAPAVLAALAATKTGRRVRVRYNRDQDMMLTGNRHPFLAKFEIGFDESGMLLAAKIDLFADAGWSLDLSRAITDRALFHLDNAYFIPNADFSSVPVKTNLASNTAFRGFGGPQGMLVIEEILDRIARHLDLPPETVRERNLYRGSGETNTTHYGQEIEDNRIQRIWRELQETSGFAARRAEIAQWNSAHPHRKRGIAMTPVKFGISFTTTHLNQAGALVLLYQDGTVQVNHGGTEMGQGVHTNIAMIAAKELGVPLENVRVMATRTDKVPNTSATAASCGTDLNGAAVKNACEKLRARIAPFLNTHPTFLEALRAAYFARVSLSATGFYRTPDIFYDVEKGFGKPFHYFAVGAAVTEVEVDGFTGAMQILRTDILHDIGDAINEGVARGQVEGGFVQGAGWLTVEQLVWNDKGVLLTHSPDTYKIPAVGDTPRVFNVAFLSDATQPGTIHGSKAVGEPPLMLAISVREAIRDAVAAFGKGNREIPLASPATSEAIFKAIKAVAAA